MMPVTKVNIGAAKSCAQHTSFIKSIHAIFHPVDANEGVFIHKSVLRKRRLHQSPLNMLNLTSIVDT
jgi:hypothetical protein